MLFHQGKGTDFGNGVNAVADDWHHFHDAGLGAPGRKVFHHIQANRAAPNDHDLLPLHVLRVIAGHHMLNHI